jgi:hypothetical protein
MLGQNKTEYVRLGHVMSIMSGRSGNVRLSLITSD